MISRLKNINKSYFVFTTSVLLLTFSVFISPKVTLLLLLALAIVLSETGHLNLVSLVPKKYQQVLSKIGLIFSALTGLVGIVLILRFPASKLYGSNYLNVYYVMLTITLLFLYALTKCKYRQSSIPAMPNSRPKLKPKHYIFALSIVFFFIMLAARTVGQFITVDEPKWIFRRIPSIVTAIRSTDFRETIVSDKPGLLPSYLVVPSLVKLRNQKLVGQGADSVRQLTILRTPIILFNALMLLIIIYQVFLLSGKWQIALLSGLLIVSTPFLIAITQIINPDAVLWSLGSAALLQYLIAFKHNSRLHFILAGVLVGLSLAAKFTAATIYIFTIIHLILLTIDTAQKPDFAQRLTNQIYLVLLSWLVSVFTITALYPYSWFHLNQILRSSLGSLLLSISIPASIVLISLLVFAANKYPSQLQQIFVSAKKYLAYVLGIIAWPLLVAISAVTIISVLFSQSKLIAILPAGKLSILANSLQVWGLGLPITLLLGFLVMLLLLPYKRISIANKSLIIFIIVYLLGTVAKGLDNSIRYQIMLLPIFAFFAAQLIWLLGKWSRLLMLIVVVVYSIAIAFTPFPWVYTNELGKNTALNWHWGYGGYQMAQEINTKAAKGAHIVGDLQGVDVFLRADLTYSSISPNYLYSAQYPDPTLRDLDAIIADADIFVLNSRGKLTTVYQDKWQIVKATHPLVTDDAIQNVKSVYSLPREHELCLNNNLTQCWWLSYPN